MRLNRLASLAVVTAAAALSVRPGHAANDEIAPQGGPGRGGHESAPVALADGLATAPDGGGGTTPSSDAVLELVSFVRAR